MEPQFIFPIFSYLNDTKDSAVCNFNIFHIYLYFPCYQSKSCLVMVYKWDILPVVLAPILRASERHFSHLILTDIKIFCSWKFQYFQIIILLAFSFRLLVPIIFSIPWTFWNLVGENETFLFVALLVWVIIIYACKYTCDI